MSGTLHWICCPQCREIADLHRVGQVGNIVKAAKQDHVRIVHSKRVRCGFCGLIFRTDGATIFEAMGRDTVSDTPY